MRRARSIWFATTLLAGAAWCSSASEESNKRSDAIALAMYAGGVGLKGSGQSFNVILGDVEPYFPAFVASKGVARRTFIVLEADRCELKGKPFGATMYREASDRRPLTVSELEPEVVVELRAFSNSDVRQCTSAVRRCGGLINPALCVSVVHTSGENGLIVTSSGRHAKVERLDSWFSHATERDIPPEFVDMVSLALNSEDARILGLGRFGVATKNASGLSYYPLRQQDANGIALLSLESAVAEINERALRRDPVVIRQSMAITKADVYSIYATAGFDRPAWRVRLRSHPALFLIQP